MNCIDIPAAEYFTAVGFCFDIRNVRRETFDITVPVDISGTFYAWVTQFVGEMTIIAPGHVREAYAEYAIGKSKSIGGTNPGDAGNGAADPERTGSGMMRGRQKEPSFFRAGMVGYRWGLE